jgi:hypothetical protein
MRSTKSIPASVALERIKAAGYEPIVPYPNNTYTPWEVRCTTCGATRHPTLGLINQGRGRCSHINEHVSAEEAERILRAAHYEPLEAYPGTKRATWKAICTVCGQRRSPSLQRIAEGRVCKHKNPAMPTRATRPPSPEFTNKLNEAEQWVARHGTAEDAAHILTDLVTIMKKEK